MKRWAEISAARRASWAAEQRVGMMRASVGLAKAAPPFFPYRHRSCAETWGQ